MVTSDEDQQDVYIAWSDSRSGRPEIYVKRTDSIVGSVILQSATPSTIRREILGRQQRNRCRPEPEPPRGDRAARERGTSVQLTQTIHKGTHCERHLHAISGRALLGPEQFAPCLTGTASV